MKRRALAAAVLVAFVAALAWALWWRPLHPTGTLLSRPLPAFSLPRLDDPARRVSAADLAGKPALVNVWGTWCTACRQEHELLMQIARDWTVYGWNYLDDPAKARQWLRQLGDPYVLVMVDADGAAARELGVAGAPETYVLDGRGNIVFRHVGLLTPAVWARDIEPRLRRLGSASDKVRGGS
jgi:cytochrome c biogenesis protein CcmG/thiol:disulfide interchange protein DsbE